MSGEYLLQTWGGFYNEEHRVKHGEKPGFFWFDTWQERAAEVARLREIEKRLKAVVLMVVNHDGEFSQKKLIAKMVFVYDGKRYPFAYDFGYGFETENAEYMFFDGNYSCDCNKSLFIGRTVEGFPEMECGDEIKIEDFTTEYVPRTGERYEPHGGDKDE